MKIVRYAHSGEVFWGVLPGNGVTPLTQAGEVPGFEALLQRARAQAGAASQPVPMGAVKLLAPLLPSATVYCVGINYRAHASEAGRELPPYPSLFLRRQASLVGSGEPLEYPRGSTQYDFEGELALVIGTGGRDISEADAPGHIAAYTCLNDGSARDFQRHSVTAGKNFEASGACGPWLVAADALDGAPGGSAGAVPGFTLVTRLNGKEMQRVNTGEMIYTIPALVSYVSRFARLEPGDIISTGTPEGVGAARTPPVWMAPGDRISVEISGIGTLENTVAQVSA